MGFPYTAYAASLPSTAHLAGLLICVHIVNGFSRMCRESGLWLMHIGTYVRIKAGDGSIWWSRRWMMGRYGWHIGYCASKCRLQSAYMAINATPAWAQAAIRLYDRLCSNHCPFYRHIAENAFR